MTLFFALLTVHILADFYLQPHSWIMSKVKHKERSIGLFKHMCVHLLLTFSVLFLFIGSLNLTLVVALSAIIISHYAIDIWKTYMGFTTKYFVIDQTLHILILIGVAFYLSNASIDLSQEQVVAWLSGPYVPIFIAYVLAYKPLSILIQLLLRPYLNQFDADQQQNKGLQTAGEHIGALERILIITFVLLGQYAGVGFLLAAKSIFRFGDMRREQDRKLTEYIMLGTLLSFTLAILIGIIVNKIIETH